MASPNTAAGADPSPPRLESGVNGTRREVSSLGGASWRRFLSRTGKPSEENKSKGKTDRVQLKLNRRRKKERANRQSMMLRCSERRFVTDSRDEEHRGEGRTLRASNFQLKLSPSPEFTHSLCDIFSMKQRSTGSAQRSVAVGPGPEIATFKRRS